MTGHGVTPEPPSGSEHYREGWRHGYEQAGIDRLARDEAAQAVIRAWHDLQPRPFVMPAEMTYLVLACDALVRAHGEPAETETGHPPIPGPDALAEPEPYCTLAELLDQLSAQRGGWDSVTNDDLAAVEQRVIGYYMRGRGLAGRRWPVGVAEYYERDRGTYGDGTASYPGDPGREHEQPSAPVDWPARFRAAADEAQEMRATSAEILLRQLANVLDQYPAGSVEAIGRALLDNPDTETTKEN